MGAADGDGDYRLGEALDGMFDEHYGELASLLLDQIAFLDQRITRRCPSGAPS